MKSDRIFESDQMVKKISNQEFKDSGMLWVVNSILHLFGMAIVWDVDTDSLYAANVRFRGFSERNNDMGYHNITQYMVDNATELLKDCE